jgi:C_GCAxxG_C_C family probable redox protein
MTRGERAVETFNKCFNCAQTLLSTYGKEFGLEQETAFRVAAAFGSGMARMADTCGAVTGAFMIIGLKYGKIRADDDESKEKTYSLVKEFVKRFKARNKSIICRDLLGYDVSKPEELKYVEENKIIKEKCPKFVQDAAEIIEELLD